eukprot:CAMPEP_0182530728 /NCGR_PEP_ID=MMETSP1323-20130603/6527_1 /TAXON_ID=236787 /ORGANISM="Florenciella parvula, Strain RCC1693" /LENGTH=197 /DNA_ID=CAMNT_0024740057 /DNA_START=177 /DNA_END=771 /DNA_ORIENTATION=+
MADHAAVLEAAQLLGCPTVWTAAAAGDVDALRLAPDGDLNRADLVSRGVDVRRELLGPTPLWIAASSGSVRCLRLLIRVGADVDGDYDDLSPLEAAKPSSARNDAWARDRIQSHHGAVVAALGVRLGTGVDGAPSPLRRLDDRAAHLIGEFLRSPGRAVRRLQRALWVWEGEERHAAACARAAARGWRREDHCFSVF